MPDWERQLLGISAEGTITRGQLAERLGQRPNLFAGNRPGGRGLKVLRVDSRLGAVYLVSDVGEWLEGAGKRFYNAWHGINVRDRVPAALRDDYDKLAELVSVWESKVEVQAEPLLGWASGCWIWTGGYQDDIPRWQGRSLRQLVFAAIFPDVQVNLLTAKCGAQGCINPEHLVDTTAAFWEDMTFLLDQGVRTSQIQTRLDFERWELTHLYHSDRSEQWGAIADRFRRKADIESGTYDFESEKEQLAQVIELRPERRAA